LKGTLKPQDSAFLIHPTVLKSLFFKIILPVKPLLLGPFEGSFVRFENRNAKCLDFAFKRVSFGRFLSNCVHRTCLPGG